MMLESAEDKNSEISSDDLEADYLSNYQTFLECPNFYEKIAHMEQLSRVGSVLESKISKSNKKRSDSHNALLIRGFGGTSGLANPQIREVRFRHSNIDCRRSFTPV